MIAKKEFLNTLIAMSSEEGISNDLLFKDIERSFLRYGSETDENVECVQNLSVGVVEGSCGGAVKGLMTSDSKILLSDIMNAIEDLDLPKELKEYFPSLSDSEWDAATRMITMVLLSLENDIANGGDSS